MFWACSREGRVELVDDVEAEERRLFVMTNHGWCSCGCRQGRICRSDLSVRVPKRVLLIRVMVLYRSIYTSQAIGSFLLKDGDRAMMHRVISYLISPENKKLSRNWRGPR